MMRIDGGDNGVRRAPEMRVSEQLYKASEGVSDNVR
jgi:hypothetical protein